MDTTLANRLQTILDEANISQVDLARAAGLTKGAINQMLNGGIMSIKYVKALGISARYGYSAEWITSGKGLKKKEDSGGGISLSRDMKGLLPKPSMIPVAGLAQLGENGWYEEITTPGVGGYVEAHSSDPDAYALRVRGDSMFPAIRDGWYVVVEPNGTPAAGEYVAIALKDGRKMVKEFLFRGASGVSVQSVNGEVRLSIMDDEILTIHAIGAVLMPSKHREI